MKKSQKVDVKILHFVRKLARKRYFINKVDAKNGNFVNKVEISR